MLLVGCELVFPLWRGLCLIHPVGNSLVVQGLGPCGFTAEGLGSIPGRGAEILQAVWCGQKKKYQYMIAPLRMRRVATGRPGRGRA